MITAFLALLLTSLALAGAVAADIPPQKSKESAEKPAAAPVPVPLAELTMQAEAAMASLRAIGAGAAIDDELPAIERNLPPLMREVDAGLRENTRILAQRPSLELLRNLERAWSNVRATFTAWSEELEARVTALDRDLRRIDELEGVWKETLALAQKEGAPPELIGRAQSVLSGIAKTRATVEAQRTLALKLQNRIAEQQIRVDDAIALIQAARNATLARVFTRDAPPLWRADAYTRAGERLALDSVEARENQWARLKGYVERRSDRFYIHAALFVVLAGLFFWARKRLLAWVATEPGLQRAAAVVAHPLANALVLSVIVSVWLYPQAPRLLWAIVGAAAIVPTALVLRRLAPPYLRALLYMVVVLFFVDQLRLVTASIELVPRLVFAAEMLGAAAFMLWFLRNLGKPGVTVSHPRLMRFGAIAAFAVFAATALGNALGYVALANLIGNAALRSAYAGLVYYAILEIVDALISMAGRVKPLTLFGMVRRHRDLLQRRTRKLLNAVAFVLWSLLVLDALSIRTGVIDTIHDALVAELEIGAVAVSAADVLAFVLTVWASFLVSRFVRFVLDEEIFPHARFKRGLPYAISRTVHYAILVAGFLFAMSAIGLDMTKFTILAGAFTVGVGFGLQNIFNNFVSGLILLFERPVQVGDVIQMDDAAGVVERIGIRATIVRTTSGSEVIVPNGKLISDRLINWTFSKRYRGIEVGLSVNLGSDPARVIEIMERIARDHERVLKEPPPEALLVRVGPDWMGFELRAATDEVENWVRVRSELAVTITTALKAESIQLR